MASAVEAIGLACSDCACHFGVMRFKRRAVGEHDVHVAVKFCGICHTDVNFARGKVGALAQYPMVPGHEIAGVCVAVGRRVTKFSVGDHVGVGCFVDSCLTCSYCDAGEEQYCQQGMVRTYSANDTYGRAANGPGFEALPTLGGYSNQLMVHERFAIKLPQAYPLEKAGPLMCAAVSVYEPLKHHRAGKNTRLGIMGLGGLGMMAIKLGKAMGCHVTVLSRSDAKRPYATRLGADRYIATADEAAVKAAAGSLDLILNTVSAPHNVGAFLALLATDGTMVLIGVNPEPHAIPSAQLIFQRKSVCGSLMGGISATQEVVDLCARHGIEPETELVRAEEISAVFEKLEAANDAGVRYVLDVQNSLTERALVDCAQLRPPDFGDASVQHGGRRPAALAAVLEATAGWCSRGGAPCGAAVIAAVAGLAWACSALWIRRAAK